MAFFPDGVLNEAKSDAPRRAGAGEKSFTDPGGTAAESKIYHQGCQGCSKKTSHNIVDQFHYQIGFASNSDADIADAKKVTWKEAWRVQCALEAIDYTFRAGYLISGLYNAGTAADNPTQHNDYELRAVSGQWLTLYGANPKRLRYEATRRDLDSFLGGGPYIVGDVFYRCLTEGAEVVFKAPSCLENKLRPRIIEVEYPESDAEEVQFRVKVWNNCSAAMDPENAKFPPADGKYYVRVYSYVTRPQGWSRYEKPDEMQFTPKSATLNRAALDALPGGGVYTLTRTGGGNTRVIIPSMEPGFCWVRAYTATGQALQTDAWVEARLSTVQGASTWTTTLDLSDLVSDEDVTSVQVGWWAEAVGADSSRIPYTSRCANSHHVPSGHGTHDGGQRCLAIECDGFDNFRAGCWQPGASKFCLGHEGNAYQGGNMAEPVPADDRRGSRWGRLWLNQQWSTHQGIPGVSNYANFRYEKDATATPSIGELLGTWYNGEVPTGIFSRINPTYGPVLGLRVTDETGDTPEQELQFGAFVLEDTWTAGEDPPEGILSQKIIGWDTKPDGNGGTLAGGLEYFPWRGMGSVHLYDGGFGGTSYGMTQQLVDDEELFVVAANVREGSAAARAAVLRARLEGADF